MAENNFNKGGGSSSGDESPRRRTTTGIDRTSRSTSTDDSSSEQEDSSSSDYEISLPDRITDDDTSDSSTNGENSSNTVTPTRGSGSDGGSSSSGSPRRRTTTGVDRTSRSTSTDDSDGRGSAGGNSSTTVTPTRGSGSDGKDTTSSSGEETASSDEARRQTTTGIDRTSRATTSSDSPETQAEDLDSSQIEAVKGQALAELRPTPDDPQAALSKENTIPRAAGRRVTEDDLEVTVQGDEATVTFDDDFRRSVIREQSAESIDAETDVDITGDDVRVTGAGDDVDVTLRRDAERKVLQRRAAEDDPLRDADDFVVEYDESGSPDVRKRAAPFFEDQREAIGLDTPNESKIRRGLQEASAEYSKIVEAEDETQLEGVDPIDDTIEESGVDVPTSISKAGEVEEDFTEGAERALNLPGNVLGGVGIVEQGANLVQADFETRSETFSDPNDVGSPLGEDAEFSKESEATAKALTQTGEAVVETARERPGLLLGGVAAGAVTGIAAGRGIGRVARSGRDRVRTAGATDITEGVTNPKTRQFFEEDGTGGDRFPAAQDSELYKRDPAEAVRKQAEDFTPSEVDEVYEAAGVEGGATLKKALDVDPEGPGSAGFKTQSGDYESPGSFAGPEVSPNFFGGISSPRQSLRPGLPSTGGKPTGALVRTDVENPKARGLDEFNEELLAREGETTARTKPASEVNTGEIEAVIPPEASFVNVAERSLTTRAARSLGIGAEFQVSYGGRQIPLRPVARQSDVGGLDDAAEAAGATSSRTSGRFKRKGRSVEYYSDVGSQPVDRPAPVTPTSASSPSESIEVSGSASAPDLDVTTTYSEADSDVSSGLDESPVESPAPSSSPSAPSSSGVPSSSSSSSPSPSRNPSPSPSPAPSSPPGSPSTSPSPGPSPSPSSPGSASPSPSPSPAPASTTPPAGLDPDLPDGGNRKKRDPDFSFFERDVIAPVDEDPLSSIDESLKDL